MLITSVIAQPPSPPPSPVTEIADVADTADMAEHRVPVRQTLQQISQPISYDVDDVNKASSDDEDWRSRYVPVGDLERDGFDRAQTLAPGTRAVTDAPTVKHILCVRTISQTEERFPYDGNWMGCLIPADEWERSDSRWTQDDQIDPSLPFHAMEKTPDDRFYHVAVAKSWVPRLQEHGFTIIFEEGLRYGVAKPRESDINVRGAQEAKRRAFRQFIRNAVHGVSAGPRYGLDRYYRAVTFDQRLLVPIEWAILIRDILALPDEIFDRFLVCYLFFSLLGLGDLHSASAWELLTRGRKEWAKHFKEMGKENTKQEALDAGLEMQKLAVFRGIVEWAGGRRDASQQNWDLKYSTNFNLALVVYSLGMDVGTPVPLHGFDAPKIREALLQHQSLKFSKSDVSRLQDIPRYVRIGFPSQTYESFPPGLVHSLPYETIYTVQGLRFETYRNTPGLRKPKNDIRLLLCYCGVSRRDANLLDYANSQEGSCLFHLIVNELRGIETADQTVLNLKTLLVLELFRGTQYEIGPTYGCHLNDFIRLLDGNELINRRATLAQMLLSIMSFRGEMCRRDAYEFVLAVNGEEPPPHDLGWLSDRFWEFKFTYGQATDHALQEMRLRITKGSKALEDLDWEILDSTGVAVSTAWRHPRDGDGLRPSTPNHPVGKRELTSPDDPRAVKRSLPLDASSTV